MNRRALLTLAAAGLALPAFAHAAEPAKGRLIRLSAVPSAHVKPRDVTIWLPPGYDASDDRYPVLYMHDGQNLFEAATANFGEWGVDEHLERLIAGGQARAPIVVGVWNTDLRLREYIPADLLAALPDDMRAEVQGIYGGPALSDGYVRFLTEELKPLIDGRFRTRTGPADTTISGSSMGGLISMYAVMKRPDVFSAAACLSTHWPLKVQGLEVGPQLDAWRERLVAAWTGVIERGLPESAAHRFYFDRGDETLDGFYADFQTAVDATFRRKGYGPDRFTSLVFPGAQHNEGSWNSRLDVPLTFLLNPTHSPA